MIGNELHRKMVFKQPYGAIRADDGKQFFFDGAAGKIVCMDDAADRVPALSSKVQLIRIFSPAETGKIDTPIDKILDPGGSLTDDDFYRLFVA